MDNTWVDRIIEEIDAAISNRSITKMQLADGLETIAEHAGGWAEALRSELKEERDA